MRTWRGDEANVLYAFLTVCIANFCPPNGSYGIAHIGAQSSEKLNPTFHITSLDFLTHQWMVFRLRVTGVSYTNAFIADDKGAYSRL